MGTILREVRGCQSRTMNEISDVFSLSGMLVLGDSPEQ